MKYIVFLLVNLCIINHSQAQKEVKVEKIEEIVVTDTNPNGQKGNNKVVTIKLKGDKAKEKKMVVEIDGEKVKINGKDVAELKDVDVNIGENRIVVNGQAMEWDGDFPNVTVMPRNGRVYSYRNGRTDCADCKEKAMLGIVMEKTDAGVKVNEVTENSGAAKANLKEGDIITKIDDKEIKTEMDITNYISTKKPNDEITVEYKRDGKSNKQKVTLGKRNTQVVEMYRNGQENFNFNFDGMMQDLNQLKRDGRENFNFAFAGRQPKLGMSLIETEDDKGLEVKEVEEESAAAKAGMQKGDIIIKVNGNKVTTVADIKKEVREGKQKPLQIIYLRNGKETTTEVKFPKQLKEVDL